MQKKIVPVLLLTGYLGSGKTTLVNNILSNRKGIRFAVIVNDIGEVNIDADLIQRGGVVGQKDESLVALQNGCICCTLKMDLIEQLADIMRQDRFDYIVIEASGICEPEPIARTICSIPAMGPEYVEHGISRLDCVVTVVDALRMQSEFGCGENLTKRNLGEDDIENLLIEQIEFCNVVLLNKVDEVEPRELERIKLIIKQLQPEAEIFECNYGNVDLEKLLNTDLFSYNNITGSAGWVKGIEKLATEEEEREARADHSHHHHHDHDHDEHHHCHHDHDHDHEHHDDDDDEVCEVCGGHHHHHHDEDGHECCCGHHHHHDGNGEVEEYGIGTFVYYRRKPFNIEKFDNFVATKWPRSIIRAKGVCYFSENTDMSYLFEQAGVQKKMSEAGLWYATAPADELEILKQQNPDMMHDWDEVYGDRMDKIVFIGQKMDKEQIIRDLDDCIEE